ncbi:hypothetical protein BOTBODRAFT_190272 [Botryobasidium botryosum FD-172 SS1]|uniref:Uncharacterized protein n=1 Tax=Botryobasidium botryosum (strain FD-172 SS1) TaxID=930990 RepID=A0A067M4Z4_BOTB1|nr:hypothetical protein BOTBODRAFT_190272 [Botryobasidium botryosum FD-172 SS1]
MPSFTLLQDLDIAHANAEHLSDCPMRAIRSSKDLQRRRRVSLQGCGVKGGAGPSRCLNAVSLLFELEDVLSAIHIRQMLDEVARLSEACIGVCRGRSVHSSSPTGDAARWRSGFRCRFVEKTEARRKDKASSSSSVSFGFNKTPPINREFLDALEAPTRPFSSAAFSLALLQITGHRLPLFACAPQMRSFPPPSLAARPRKTCFSTATSRAILLLHPLAELPPGLRPGTRPAGPLAASARTMPYSLRIPKLFHHVPCPTP